jgi:hypothetical protein
MSMDPPDWSKREAQMAGQRELKSEDPDALENLSVRLFRTRDGRLWLQKMLKIRFDLSQGPDSPAPRLYYLEGQRQILRDIVHAIERAEAKESEGK